MAVRNFAADNSEIRVPTGTIAVTGAFTVAALLKFQGVLNNYRSVIAGHNSAGTYQWEFGAGGGNWLAFYSVAQAVESDSTFTIGTTTWSIVAYTKPAGASTGKFHLFPLGGSWTHSNGNASIGGNPASIASGSIRFGEAQDADDYNGRLAVTGVWDAELSDVQVEALATGLATTAWTGHAVTPGDVWEFNQATNTDDVVGLVQGLTATGTISGTTDTTGTAGTTVVTGDDPPGWTFGAGATPEVIPALAMAPYRGAY